MDEQVARQRFRRGTPATIRVSTRDAEGRLTGEVDHEVLRPQSPERQYEQLARIVQDEMPDARPTASRPGEVTFACRGYAIAATYIELPAQIPSES